MQWLLGPESLASEVCVQKVKLILNPVLPLSFPWEPGQSWTGSGRVLLDLDEVLHTFTDKHSFLALSLKCLLVLSYSSS